MPFGPTVLENLRARRDLVQPADVGLATVGRARVPDLRREEVAMLAGIGSDYYLRLEQGRGPFIPGDDYELLYGLSRLTILILGTGFGDRFGSAEGCSGSLKASTRKEPRAA
jgi:transcriptional regulator with XRE-family HTH domain